MINQWFTEYSHSLERIPTSVRFAARSAQMVCCALDIYQNGTIVGTCQEMDKTYRVFAGFLLSGHSMGCECRESRGKSPCRHIAAFLAYLIESLANLNSDLRRRIVELEFSPKEPDYESFKPSLYQLELDALDRVIASRTRCIEPLADELSIRIESAATLIAWDFSLMDGKLVVQPCQQIQSRGTDAWSKGRPIQPSILWSPPLLVTGADLEAKRRINASSDMINPVDIAILLVHQSNILFDGKPITIAKIDLLLELRRSDQLRQCVLASSLPGNAHRRHRFRAKLKSADSHVAATQTD